MPYIADNHKDEDIDSFRNRPVRRDGMVFFDAQSQIYQIRYFDNDSLPPNNKSIALAAQQKDDKASPTPTPTMTMK